MLSQRSLENRAGLPPEVVARLAAELASQRTLEDVVRWGLAQRPPQLIAEVIVQDEYTHDVVLPVELDSAAGVAKLHYLVYDST